MSSPAARLRAPASPVQILETEAVVVGGGVAGTAEAGARAVCEKVIFPPQMVQCQTDVRALLEGRLEG